jgi:drug/metabolite transporter (DMT)-like permease
LKVVLVPAVVLLFPVLPSLSAHRPAKPWWLAALAALLVVAGVAVMELAGARPRLGVGQLWALGQVFGFGMGYICVEHTLSEFPRHALQLSALQVIVIAVLSATWSVTVASAEKGSFALPDTTWVAADGRLVVAILYTGLVTTSLTVWLQTVRDPVDGALFRERHGQPAHRRADARHGCGRRGTHFSRLRRQRTRGQVGRS